MSTVAQLLEQRARGAVTLRYGATGVQVLREGGCSKLRLPRGSDCAFLINTSGGLAGGDEISVQVAVESGALQVTSQAAERVYRSLGPAAELHYHFEVGAGALLHWLPQETILFEGARLSRHMTVHLAEGAEFLAVESLVFGRAAMGECLTQLHLQDQWDIWQGARLLHAERFALGPALPQGLAGLGAAAACATMLLISPSAEQKAALIQEALGEYGAVSCWNGKLLARLLAQDGLSLRKSLTRALLAAMGGRDLPKNWSF